MTVTSKQALGTEPSWGQNNGEHFMKTWLIIDRSYTHAQYKKLYNESLKNIIFQKSVERAAPGWFQI